MVRIKIAAFLALGSLLLFAQFAQAATTTATQNAANGMCPAAHTTASTEYVYKGKDNRSSPQTINVLCSAGSPNCHQITYNLSDMRCDQPCPTGTSGTITGYCAAQSKCLEDSSKCVELPQNAGGTTGTNNTTAPPTITPATPLSTTGVSAGGTGSGSGSGTGPGTVSPVSSGSAGANGGSVAQTGSNGGQTSSNDNDQSSFSSGSSIITQALGTLPGFGTGFGGTPASVPPVQVTTIIPGTTLTGNTNTGTNGGTVGTTQTSCAVSCSLTKDVQNFGQATQKSAQGAIDGVVQIVQGAEQKVQGVKQLVDATVVKTELTFTGQKAQSGQGGNGNTLTGTGANILPMPKIVADLGTANGSPGGTSQSATPTQNPPPANPPPQPPAQQPGTQPSGQPSKLAQEVTKILNTINPITPAQAEPNPLQALKDQVNRDLQIAQNGLRTGEGLNWYPNEQEQQILFKGRNAAARLIGEVKQLGDAALSEEIKGYVGMIDSLSNPENQSKSYFNQTNATGDALVTKVQDFVDRAPASQPPAPPVPSEPKVLSFGSVGGQLEYPGLAGARARYAQELQSPQVRGLLMTSTEAEVGGQGPTAEQAYIEAVMNRAASTGATLQQTLTSQYDPNTGKGYYPASTINKLGQIPEQGVQNRLNGLINNALAGSNISNLATGNESGGRVCFGSCVSVTFNPGTGERFVLENSGVNWYNSTKTALGQPTLGTGQVPTPAPCNNKGCPTPTPNPQVAAARVQPLAVLTAGQAPPPGSKQVTDPTNGVSYSCTADPSTCVNAFQKQLALSRLCQSNSATCNATVGTYKETATGNTTQRPTTQQISQVVQDTLFKSYEASPHVDSFGAFGIKDVQTIGSDSTCKTLECQVIGGMSTDFQNRLYALIQAAAQQGINIGIDSGYRSNARQALATGNVVAAVGGSNHGGSRVGGYGNGIAADLVGVNGTQTQIVENFVDQHSQQFGLYRPLPNNDGEHTQPTGSTPSAVTAVINSISVVQPTYTLTDSNGSVLTGTNGQPLVTTQTPGADGTAQFLTNADGTPLLNTDGSPIPVAPVPVTQSTTNPDQYSAPDDRPPQPPPVVPGSSVENPWPPGSSCDCPPASYTPSSPSLPLSQIAQPPQQALQPIPQPLPQPQLTQGTVTITAQPTLVTSGRTSLIIWNSSNTISCSVGQEGGSLLGTGISGSIQSQALSTTTIFAAFCQTQAGANVSATTSVTVQ